MLKFMIVDDHSIVREGLIKLLMAGFPTAKFYEAGSALELMNVNNNLKFDLVILDINLPGRSGLEILKEFKSEHPKLPVVIFSLYPEEQYAIRAIKAGASAYLSKSTPSQEIIEVVKKVLSGEIHLTPLLSNLISEELRGVSTDHPHNTLSDREHQVFLLIASGKNITSIGAELSLSVKTISVYRANILKKMNLKNNAEITHYAFKNGLVE